MARLLLIRKLLSVLLDSPGAKLRIDLDQEHGNTGAETAAITSRPIGMGVGFLYMILVCRGFRSVT
jgi:hypothetical protein